MRVGSSTFPLCTPRNKLGMYALLVQGSFWMGLIFISVGLWFFLTSVVYRAPLFFLTRPTAAYVVPNLHYSKSDVVSTALSKNTQFFLGSRKQQRGGQWRHVR